MPDMSPNTRFEPGLYVVATPIGNLGDLSPRACATLTEAQIVAAEDTRTSAVILRQAASTAPMVSLTEHNVAQRIPELLAAAREGVVALVSDAGTPVVADPGARLVDAAHEASIRVFTVPGPSALVAALSVSGFAGDDVHFLGFLPRPKGQRIERLQHAAGTASVLVFFESPNRLPATLGEVAECIGDPRVVVCRELTKLHEEVVRGRASELSAHFPRAKGEITVVVEVPSGQIEAVNDDDVLAYLGEMKRAEARRSPAAAEAARRFGIERTRAYQLWEQA
ncbi:MAG: 16S rRNA (cytidine(1402)-2'-O)-methyltransferase [Dehalococcoidia bacterium]|nr:16S rRNA (cytidine(1402)-2'-O)-methyltransferase [Dehalococcoidia bacterium]